MRFLQGVRGEVPARFVPKYFLLAGMKIACIGQHCLGMEIA
jgi:hypothetical protein